MAQAFLHRKCFQCQQPCADWVATHFCSQCGSPQPLTNEDDFFAALGVERLFSQDSQLLEKRFYEASRVLHPDRFVTAGAEVRALSMARMTFLNKAYTTLKDSTARRSYLLELEGALVSSSKLPAELAESWFEVQDLLAEDRSQAVARLARFEKEMDVFSAQLDQQIVQLENTYDRQRQSNEASSEVREQLNATLASLAQAIQPLSYLASLRRDVERIKSHAHSD